MLFENRTERDGIAKGREILQTRDDPRGVVGRARKSEADRRGRIGQELPQVLNPLDDVAQTSVAILRFGGARRRTSQKLCATACRELQARASRVQGHHDAPVLNKFDPHGLSPRYLLTADAAACMACLANSPDGVSVYCQSRISVGPHSGSKHQTIQLMPLLSRYLKMDGP